MQCPICAKLRAPCSPFCDQDCFKANWLKHVAVHQLYTAVRTFKVPPFKYTGPLRPHYVSPRRTVPDHIQKPDYAITGVPLSERTAKASYTTPVYTDKEIEGIRAACVLGRKVLDMAGRMVKPGVLPEDIDIAVHKMTVENNAYPSPLNYRDFPKACCISVNEVVCHGIPDFRPLQDGDIVNIDISVYLNGFHGDLNETYLCGNVDDNAKKLIKTSHDSMMAAISEVKPGVLFRDFGNTITRVCRENGFGGGVVRSYCGHGIGELFHCAPNVPHYANNKAVGACKPGMVFTIEPMINEGTWKDVTWPDDWTSTTEDGKRSAQFEHTVLVTAKGFEILTARLPDSPKHWWELEAEAKKAAAKAAAKASAAASAADADASASTGGEAAAN